MGVLSLYAKKLRKDVKLTETLGVLFERFKGEETLVDEINKLVERGVFKKEEVVKWMEDDSWSM